MTQAPLANKGNYLHIYDFRVQAGHEDEFVRLFEEFDYSDGNPMHKSSAQIKDGVLCRDVEDPQRFFLIAEWSDIDFDIEMQEREYIEIENAGSNP